MPNPQAGRPRKPAALKVKEGTFRQDRASVQQITPEGKPKKPRGLNTIASKCWDDICKHRALWVGSSDARSLELVCIIWAEMHIAYADGNKALWMKLMDKWHRESSKFGLDPLSREKLGAADVKDSHDLEKQYFG